MTKNNAISRFTSALLVALFAFAGTFSINAIAANAKKENVKVKKHSHCHRHIHKHGWSKKTRKRHNHRHCHTHFHFFRNPRHGYKFGKGKLHKGIIHKNHHALKSKKKK